MFRRFSAAVATSREDHRSPRLGREVQHRRWDRAYWERLARAALAAAKRRGVKLGGDRGARLTAKARAAGRAAVQARARNRALDLAPTIQELQAGGCVSLRAIAAGLEERGIPAARGGKWSAVQVARLLEAAALPFGASDGGVVEPSNTLRLARFAMAAASSGDRQAA
jgi:hypothetical protein